MKLFVLTDARTPSLRMAAEHLRPASCRMEHDKEYETIHGHTLPSLTEDTPLKPDKVLWAQHKTIADRLEALVKPVKRGSEDASGAGKGDQIVITVPRIDPDQIERTSKILNHLTRMGVVIFWFSSPEWFDTCKSVYEACKDIKKVHRFTNPFYVKEADKSTNYKELADYIEYRLAYIFIEPEQDTGTKKNEEDILLEIITTLSRNSEMKFSTPDHLKIHQPKNKTSQEGLAEPPTLCARFREKGYPSFAGNSRIIEQLKERLIRLAASDQNVLIIGDTGTGKENAAYFLHEFSRRQKKPFLELNCAGFEDTILESTLFGHIKGAFTGADRDKVGMVKLADGGTLFLDELHDASPRLQAKLLRFLESGEFYAVGSAKREKVAVKIVAGAQSGLLRDRDTRLDFIQRIAKTQLWTPTLRELNANNQTGETGKEPDVLTIARNLAARLVGEPRVGPDRTATSFTHKDLVDAWDQLGSTDTRDALMGYDWPGNVRELKNVIYEWLCVGFSLKEALAGRTKLLSRLNDETADFSCNTVSCGDGWSTSDGPDGKPLVSFRPVSSLHKLATVAEITSMYVKHINESLKGKGFTQRQIGNRIGLKHNTTFKKYCK